MGAIHRYSFATREEALENGVQWTYGYASDPKFLHYLKEQVGDDDIRQYDVELFFFFNYLPNAKVGHKGFPTDITREEH